MRPFVAVAGLSLAAFSSIFAQSSADSVSKHIDIEEISIQAVRTNAKLKDLPQKVELIRLREIKSSPAKDVGELLKINSSIDIIQYPGLLSSVGMRGFAPTTNNKYNALLVNGVPAGTRNISTLGLGNVSQIEILKGPFSSMYGSTAMSGVINIVTPRHKDSLHGSASVGMGSFMTSHSDVAAGGRIAGPVNFDFTASASNQGVDYTIGRNNILAMSATDLAIIDAKETNGSVFKNSKYSQVAGNLRLGVDIGKNWEIHFNQGLYTAKDVLSHGSYWAVYGDSKKDLFRYTERIEVEGRMGKHTLSFTPYLSHETADNYNEDSDTAFISTRGIFRTYGAVLYDRISIGKHSIVAGISNATDRNESERWSNDSTRTAPYTPDYSNTSNAAFLQTNFHFFEDKLHFAAGARLEQIDFSLYATDRMENVSAATEHYTSFNPNVGFKWNFLSWANIHGSWGTAFFAPDASNKAGNYINNGITYRGNPDLDPETSQTFDGGIGIAKRDIGVAFDATVFVTEHKKLISSVKIDPDGIIKSGDEYTSYANAQKADMTGLEIAASYDLGSLFEYRFSLKAYTNATFMLKTKVHINDTVTQDQKYVRKQNANFGLEYVMHNGLRFRANGRYIGSRIEDNWFSYYAQVRSELPALAQESQPEYAGKGLLHHPAFMVFDFSAHYDITNHFSCGATVSNLLDENYTEKDGYNMPGRAIMGKFTVRF